MVFSTILKILLKVIETQHHFDHRMWEGSSPNLPTFNLIEIDIGGHTSLNDQINVSLMKKEAQYYLGMGQGGFRKGLRRVLCQATTWTNTVLFLTGPMKLSFSGICIQMCEVSIRSTFKVNCLVKVLVILYQPKNATRRKWSYGHQCYENPQNCFLWSASLPQGKCMASTSFS